MSPAAFHKEHETIKIILKKIIRLHTGKMIEKRLQLKPSIELHCTNVLPRKKKFIIPYSVLVSAPLNWLVL